MPAIRRSPAAWPERSVKGQALVEFAIILPIFLAMLFGIIDFGRVVWANDSLANAAREAARFAIVHGGSASTACPVGPPGPDTTIPVASPTCPYPSPSKEAIRKTALAFAAAAGGPITVEVCYGSGCSGNTDVVGAANVRGTPVTVTIRSSVGMITGGFIGYGSFGVSGSASMLVNH